MPLVLLIPVLPTTLFIALVAIDLGVMKSKKYFIFTLPLLLIISMLIMHIFAYSHSKPDEIIKRKVSVNEGIATIFPELINLNEKLKSNFSDGEFIIEERYYSKIYFGFYSVDRSIFKKEKNESK